MSSDVATATLTFPPSMTQFAPSEYTMQPVSIDVNVKVYTMQIQMRVTAKATSSALHLAPVGSPPADGARDLSTQTRSQAMSAVIPFPKPVASQTTTRDPMLNFVGAAYRSALEAAAQGDEATIAQARVDYHLAVMAMVGDHLARLDVLAKVKR